MYRFVQKHRWIPSLHLLSVAVWILVGTVLAGFAHQAQVQPRGISIITDFAGDDLQRLVGGKELSDEVQVETEAEESGESSGSIKLWTLAHTPGLGHETANQPNRVQAVTRRPSSAQFPQPKRLYLEYEVFRI
jgi:hypothetical protein